MKCAFIFLWLAVLSLGKTGVAQSLESYFASVCEENFEPTDRLLFMHRCAQVLFREMPGTVVRTGNVMYLDDWPDRIWPETLRRSYPWQSIRTDPMLSLNPSRFSSGQHPCTFPPTDFFYGASDSGVPWDSVLPNESFMVGHEIGCVW